MELSSSNNLALSTLKFNLKIMVKLGMVNFRRGKSLKLTAFGIYILSVLGDRIRNKADFKTVRVLYE